MDVTVHIGYPKTGSTAIQSHLFANRNWFLENGVYIPLAGRASGIGHAYLLELEKSPVEQPDGYEDLRGSGAVAELTSELAQASEGGYCKALLSWEGFSLLSEDGIRKLRDGLQAHDVTLLVYVREQGALYQSTVLQAIKELRYLRESLVLRERSPREVTPERYDFSATIERWLSIFGAQLTVHSRVFDRRYLLHGNVVEDFLSVFGLRVSAGFALQRANVNRSLDFFSAAYLETARLLGVRRDRLLGLSRALTASQSELGSGSGDFLSDEERAYIRRHFAASNARLFRNYRPANIPVDLDDFMEDSNTATPAASVPGDERIASLHKYLLHPPRELWHGEILISAALARLARPPDSGWRGAESSGVWSVGRSSRIAFNVPAVHPEAGPSAILLTIAGTYYGANEKTLVHCDNRQFELCLREAKLRIELDASVREEGVEVLFYHSRPEVPPNVEGHPDRIGIAFKLQYLDYAFVWD